MRRFIKGFRYGEKGFTLIELLVVISILGILAAVVIPNVGKFFGAGKEQAANTEMSNVMTAVAAWMADKQTDDYTGDVGPTSLATTPAGFLANVGQLQATYTFLKGSLSTPYAVPITGSKWTGLTFDGTTLTWKKTTPP